MPDTRAAQDTPQDLRLQMITTLATDQGNYLPDVAFAAQDGSLSAARLHGRRYGREAALAGKPEKKSEDSFVALSHLDGAAALTGSGVKEKLQSVVATVREQTRESPGNATLVGAIAGKEGISYTSIGDSHIFIVGEENGKVLKLNLPHQMYLRHENKEGEVRERSVVLNTVGKDAEAPAAYDPRRADRYGFISYDEIREKVGGNAHIVLASDGLLDQFGLRSTQANISAFQIETAAQDRKAMQEMADKVCSTDAAILAGSALAAGSQDDIAVVSFAATPGHAAFLCDGVGGSKVPGSGAVTSQKAVQVATQEMLRDVSVQPEPLKADPFDPKAAAAQPNPRAALKAMLREKFKKGEVRAISGEHGVEISISGKDRKGVRSLFQTLAPEVPMEDEFHKASGRFVVTIPAKSVSEIEKFMPAELRDEILRESFRAKAEASEYRIVGKDYRALLALRGGDLDAMEQRLGRLEIPVEHASGPAGAPELRIDTGYKDLVPLLPPKMRERVTAIHDSFKDETADIITKHNTDGDLVYVWPICTTTQGYTGEKELSLPSDPAADKGNPSWSASRVQPVDIQSKPADAERKL